jgi:hypothetical protein
VPHVIATVVIHGPGGATLIDPGPSSTLPALRASLDHAGIPLAECGRFYSRTFISTTQRRHRHAGSGEPALRV